MRIHRFLMLSVLTLTAASDFAQSVQGILIVQKERAARNTKGFRVRRKPGLSSVNAGRRVYEMRNLQVNTAFARAPIS